MKPNEMELMKMFCPSIVIFSDPKLAKRFLELEHERYNIELASAIKSYSDSEAALKEYRAMVEKNLKEKIK